jgi:hypothetical protein
MSPPNRSEARAALAALLEAGVTSAQAVYGYQADDFAGQSPVLCVTSRASERKRLTMGDTRGQAVFGYDLHTFVLYRDPQDPEVWTPAQAEDALDQVEQEIFAVVLANPKTAAWRAIAYAEPTEARDTVIIGGVTYLHEVIPVALSVF